MLALLAALLLLPRVPSGWARCCGHPHSNPCKSLEGSEFRNESRRDVYLSELGIQDIKGSPQLGATVEKLNLSFHCLQRLPADLLSQAHGLRELYLQGNPGLELHARFLQNATRLLQLVVDCRCGVVGSVISHCTASGPANSTGLTCLCHSEQGTVNASEFHRQCQSLCPPLCAAITGSVLALLLLAGGLAGGFFLLRRKRRASVSHSKRESTASVTRGQPRYISRNTEPGPGQAPDYENVFIGPSQPAGQYECLERQGPRYRAQLPADEDCYMESDTCRGDQPIYANTQEVFSGSFPAPGDSEEVYIVPDQ